MEASGIRARWPTARLRESLGALAPRVASVSLTYLVARSTAAATVVPTSLRTTRSSVNHFKDTTAERTCSTICAHQHGTRVAWWA